MIRKYAILLFFILMAGSSLGAQALPDNAFFGRLLEISRANNSRVIAGQEDWFFLKAEIDHLASGAIDSDPLSAIVDFNRQLNARGIELILLPVPAKASLYPEKLDASLGAPSSAINYYHAAFYAELKKQAVQVLDLSPIFLAERNRGRQLYCATDAHWAPYAGEIAAAELAKIVKKRPWYAALPKQQTQAQSQSLSFSGDLLEKGSSIVENLSARKITSPNGQELQADEDSPIILMGDSHCLVFREGGDMHARGSGLFDQLCHELGIVSDLIGIRGSGANASRVSLFRKSRQNSHYLNGKKLVIWCISVREFSQTVGGWKPVPLGP